MTQNKSFPWIDWFRFLAAFIVVLAHSRMLIFVKYADLEPDSRNTLTSIFFAVTRLGNEAVLIFFVLSGFLVGGIAIERLSKSTFNLKSYLIDRATRIWIPLIPAIILMIGVSLYLDLPVNYWHVLGNTLALQSIFVPELQENAALWTLGYEIWFYFFIAALGLFKCNKAACLILLCLFIAAFTRLMPHYFVCWLIGAAAYLWKPGKSLKLLIFGIVIMIYGCLGRQVGRGSESLDIAFLQAFLPSEEMARVVFSAGFALLIGQLILIKKWPKLDNIGTQLAAFSYTLYLVHFPIIHLYSGKGLKLSSLDFHSLMTYSAVITSCLAVALIMYWLFERNTKYVRSLLKQSKQTLEKSS